LIDSYTFNILFEALPEPLDTWDDDETILTPEADGDEEVISKRKEIFFPPFRF
jgi:hypothetical protein